MTNLEDRLSKLQAYKSIQLTDEEKNALRSHAAHIISLPVPAPKESLLARGIQHGIRMALSTFLFIVFIGSSVSVVANSALPGDPLYSFKLNVNEKIPELLMKDSADKVALQKNRIENRANEIKTLAETKTLTKAKQATVNKALNTHVKALSKELNTLSSEAPSTALTVTDSLEENLLATKEAIQNSTETPTDPEVLDALKAVDSTLMLVSQQEVKILSREIDNIDEEVQTVLKKSISDGLEVKPETKTTTPPVVTPSKP